MHALTAGDTCDCSQTLKVTGQGHALKLDEING